MKYSRKRKILKKIPRNPSWLLLSLQLVPEVLCLGRSLLLSLLRSGRGAKAKPGLPSSPTQLENFPAPESSALPLAPPRTARLSHSPAPNSPPPAHCSLSFLTQLCFPSSTVWKTLRKSHFGGNSGSSYGETPSIPTQMKERGGAPAQQHGMPEVLRKVEQPRDSGIAGQSCCCPPGTGINASEPRC